MKAETEIKSVAEIKTEIESNIGKTIVIREFNKQGKRLKEMQGTILSSYNNLFLVKVNIKNNYINKSFSYIDFLTKEFVFEIIS